MNKQSLFSFAITGSALFFLTSCLVYKPTGYTTLTQNVPLLQEKYELQTMFTLGSNHFEEQLAFAATEHLSVLGNFYQYRGKKKGYSAEGGIGYRQLFANGGVMEAYGIFTNAFNSAHVQDDNGYGILIPDAEYTHDFIANYNGYSLQFNIGKKSPRIVYGIGLRYGLMDYFNFSYHIITAHEGYYNHVISDTTYYLDKKVRQFLTIAPTLKFGWTNFKFLSQLSYHIDLSKTQAGNPKKIPPYYSPLLFTIGFIAEIPFTKKNKDN